jgi:hypothetical protein
MLIATDDPNAFSASTPTADLVRQILDAVSLVAKMKGARNRKRASTGRCEGRKQALEPCRVLAIALRSDGASLRTIAT